MASRPQESVDDEVPAGRFRMNKFHAFNELRILDTSLTKLGEDSSFFAKNTSSPLDLNFQDSPFLTSLPGSAGVRGLMSKNGWHLPSLEEQSEERSGLL